jgi:hypothetical protein
MTERKLYITITAEPLHKAIKDGLPAVQHTVDLDDTSRIEMLELLRQSERKLGARHGNS